MHMRMLNRSSHLPKRLSRSGNARTRIGAEARAPNSSANGKGCVMSRPSEERKARKALRAAQHAEEVLALPYVVEETQMNLPAKPQQREAEQQCPGEALTKPPDEL